MKVDVSILIKEKDREIKNLEAQLGKAKTERKELQNALKIIESVLESVSKPRVKRARKKRTGPSIPDTVEKVLKRAGKPLHVEEISKKIGVKAARIRASLQRYIKIKKRFKRTAAATFGLIRSKKAE